MAIGVNSLGAPVKVFVMTSFDNQLVLVIGDSAGSNDISSITV